MERPLVRSKLLAHAHDSTRKRLGLARNAASRGFHVLRRIASHLLSREKFVASISEKRVGNENKCHFLMSKQSSRPKMANIMVYGNPSNVALEGRGHGPKYRWCRPTTGSRSTSDPCGPIHSLSLKPVSVQSRRRIRLGQCVRILEESRSRQCTYKLNSSLIVLTFAATKPLASAHAGQ